MRKKFWSMLILTAFTAALLLPSTVLATPITGADTDLSQLYIGITDDTIDATNATAADVDWPMSMTTIYFGSTGKFSRVYFYVSAESRNSAWTIPSTGPGAFQYFNGSDWIDIAVTNETGLFDATGIHYVSFTPPTDWAQTLVNDFTYYYLRVACESGCNNMSGSTSIDQISLLSYTGEAPATPEFSTYALMITLGITGFMVFKQTKMNGGLSQA